MVARDSARRSEHARRSDGNAAPAHGRVRRSTVTPSLILSTGRRTSTDRTLALAVAVLALGLLALLGARSATANASGCRNAHVRVSAANAPSVDRAVLCLVNQIRRAHGLRTLRADRALATVARSVMANMLRENYFADVGPAGHTPLSLIAASGYQGTAAAIAVGENLAWGTGSDATPARIVAAWMASPPHRANILSPTFHEAGAAMGPSIPPILRSGRRGAIYVMEFGARLY
jgi:uncharacterized protein YkwD